MRLLRHFENFYKAMRPALVDDECAFVWSANLNHPLYNLITYFYSDQNHVEERLDRLVQKFPQKHPHACWVHSENGVECLEDVLLTLGYKFLVTSPVLSWHVKTLPQPDFDIRKAEDVKAFTQILALTSKYEHAFAENVVRLLFNTNAEHFLGYIDDHPIGIATFFRDGETAVISNLATLAEHQRKGCGRALMLTLMQRASALGLKQLVLGTSQEAEKFYDSLGFKRQMDIHVYVKAE